MQTTPSASYSLTLRVRLSSRAGTLGQLATAIGRAGGDIGAIDIVTAGSDFIVRDVTVNSASSEHGERIVNAVRDIDDVTIAMHENAPGCGAKQNLLTPDGSAAQYVEAPQSRL